MNNNLSPHKTFRRLKFQAKLRMSVDIRKKINKKEHVLPHKEPSPLPKHPDTKEEKKP
jgi:hypothetical protein